MPLGRVPKEPDGWVTPILVNVAPMGTDTARTYASPLADFTAMANSSGRCTDRNFLFSPSNVPQLPTRDLGPGTIDNRPFPST